MFGFDIFIKKYKKENGVIKPANVKIGSAKYPTHDQAVAASKALISIPKGQHVWEQDFSNDDSKNLRNVVKYFGGYTTSKITKV